MILYYNGGYDTSMSEPGDNTTHKEISPLRLISLKTKEEVFTAKIRNKLNFTTLINN